MKNKLNQLIATITAYFVYHTNHVLRLIADLFASNTLDKLSNKYSSWYNLYLISKVLNYDGDTKSKRFVHVDKIDSIDTMIIAQISYQGINHKELELYLLQAISTIGNVDMDSVQVTNISKNASKLIFSMYLQS